MQNVKLIRAALDEAEDRDEIVLRGVVDNETLDALKTAEYQREIASLSRISDLADAYATSTVPDIELGCRGGKFTERDGTFTLGNDVFIIDGLQRVTAARLLLRQPTAKAQPRIGATVHFNTSEVWERERFRILNAERQKVSPNVLLRNMRPDSPVIDTLYNLSMDKSFVLGGRISWSQRMHRQDLMTALSFLKAIARLHSHIGPGRSHRLADINSGLNTIMQRVGRGVLRDNARTFYEIIDSCWGVRSIAFKEAAIYLRTSFMETLATVFTRHSIFWNDRNRLTVERDWIRKLASLPITDPQIVSLSDSRGKGIDLLYYLIVEHLNSGKRTRRLVPRDAAAEPSPDCKHHWTISESGDGVCERCGTERTFQV